MRGILHGRRVPAQGGAAGGAFMKGRPCPAGTSAQDRAARLPRLFAPSPASWLLGFFSDLVFKRHKSLPRFMALSRRPPHDLPRHLLVVSSARKAIGPFGGSESMSRSPTSTPPHATPRHGMRMGDSKSIDNRLGHPARPLAKRHMGIGPVIPAAGKRRTKHGPCPSCQRLCKLINL